ncbi:hypothetical protein AYO49_05195 [Verrucomicrobiaceae bacterium SCGC AG-212-N21]|nr:hypothetical protein AYO49_05195 [Verrucomicrobiaceae bacterium SCGC AG-212-N21]
MYFSDLEILFSRLKDAEYSYLLLEPVPLFGLFFGLIFFAVGLYMGQDKCKIAALIVIVLSCFSVYPMMGQRAKAQQRLVLAADITHVSAETFKRQTALRQDTKWVYYTVGAFALLALIGGGKLGTWSNIALLIGGSLAIVFSIWLHMKEAEVYHPNIKKSVGRPR